MKSKAARVISGKTATATPSSTSRSKLVGMALALLTSRGSSTVNITRLLTLRIAALTHGFARSALCQRKPRGWQSDLHYGPSIWALSFPQGDRFRWLKSVGDAPQEVCLVNSREFSSGAYKKSPTGARLRNLIPERLSVRCENL